MLKIIIIIIITVINIIYNTLQFLNITYNIPQMHYILFYFQ